MKQHDVMIEHQQQQSQSSCRVLNLLVPPLLIIIVLLQAMMFSSNVCRFAVFYFLSLSANADTDTVRGVERRLEETVDLGTAKNYVILAKTGITNVPGSTITGDIAVSPIAATAMTGFSFTKHSSDTYSTSNELRGTDRAYASDYAVPVPADLTTAVSDMETAYTDAAGRTNPDAARINFGAGLLGGAFGGATNQLTAGVYTYGTDVKITGDIYFSGSDTDIFIIQIAGSLILDAGVRVTLVHNGKGSTPLAKNIFWQVASSVKVGAGARMEGVLLVKTAVTFITGSSLNGHVLTQTACNLQQATITKPV
jgi:hypothetical protein